MLSVVTDFVVRLQQTAIHDDVHLARANFRQMRSHTLGEIMNPNTFRTHLTWLVIAILGMLIMSTFSACVPTPTPTPTGTPVSTPRPQPTPTPIQPPPGQYQSKDFGIVWSSSYYQKHFTHNPPQQAATDAGAYWDRWDFHWEWIVTPREGLNPPVWIDTTSLNYFIDDAGNNVSEQSYYS